MRKLAIILLFLMPGASAAVAMEKTPDIVDMSPPADFHSVLTGILTQNSPTHHRAFGDDVSISCDAALTDSANDGMYLDLLCVKSTDSNPIELVVEAAGTDIIDTVLTLYCSNFDLSDPVANAIAYDDDSGEGTMSAIYR